MILYFWMQEGIRELTKSTRKSYHVFFYTNCFLNHTPHILGSRAGEEHMMNCFIIIKLTLNISYTQPLCFMLYFVSIAVCHIKQSYTFIFKRKFCFSKVVKRYVNTISCTSASIDFTVNWPDFIHFHFVYPHPQTKPNRSTCLSLA
jgi:hypothetical protein